MTEEAARTKSDLVELAGDIAAAYVSNNSVPAGELGALLASIHATLVGIASGAAASSPVEEVEKPTPAQIRRSITPDGVISFIDGKSYKTLKRHLTTHGLDPRAYRERYGLPSDYPMVAPNYAAQRSALAKQIGLGRPGAQAAREAAPDQAAGRRRKAA
ncbi:MucR family transcriptional regulator [Methylobacterium dankookense]|uniref:Transcriptional regulatory protein ros n=1 Tax=Methylobacterium dankookense TaxID=560405 RepID=A0A564FY96_9HYPH|nr:MucR family transcriptional regulator [Methylobacterium dankookense]GJD58477.1 Transcriptional regulatory protein ros [Methylobacterium dankookense]VUF13159.1 Transcriptional regulatory protein ros [Methylobacterium dankookense]